MIRVGKIVATHGLGGAVIMTHIAADSKWLKKGQALMVEMQKGSFIPYFVAEFKINNGKEFVINLEDLGTIEQSKRLVAKSVYVDEEILAAYAKQSPLLWIGFTLTDVNHGLLGTIEDVMQTTNQWLGKLMYEGKEVLIPLIEPILKEVNIRSKRLIVELPHGLLEVYLD
ncbi:MAG: 16S rRNA processing protein RimM [Taibaiella sp.]|nr:16S rRNA processing protein RimM [Taibaiella sp.]